MDHDAETPQLPQSASPVVPLTRHGGWFCGSGADGTMFRHQARARTAVVAEAVDVDAVIDESVLILNETVSPLFTLMSVANP